MKKNKKVIYICIALFIILIIVACGLFVSQLQKNQWKFSAEMAKSVIIIVGLILSLFRLLKNARSKHPLSYYASVYSKYIGLAFSSDEQRKEKKELLQGIAAYSENDIGKAIKKLTALKKKCKNTDDFKAVLLFLGLSYATGVSLYDTRMINEAIKTYKELLTYDSFYPTAWSNLGNVYFELENYEEAAKCYESSTRFAPDYPQGFNNLSQAYLLMGEWEKAITPAEKALSINPKMYQAESALSIAYFGLNDEEKSKFHYEKAVSLGSDGKDINHFRALITAGDFDKEIDEEDFEDEE